MIRIRPSAERGRFDHGWLQTAHTFSFADYHDPAHMSFRSLRVLNEDRVAPGQGFATHGHRDAEIITYVVSGALAHADSLGNGSVIRAGDVQRMTAGTGVTHSEYNHSRTEPVHFLQIWILPRAAGLAPEYEQRTFALADEPGRLRLVAAGDGRDGAVTVHQDVDLYGAVLPTGAAVTHGLAAGRHAWIQVVRGRLIVNGIGLAAGDGAAVSAERTLDLRAATDAELLLFDLA
jgi:quercetin 2,3-dioxygenase